MVEAFLREYELHVTDSEEWRAIDRFPGYEVSSLGRIRSLPRLVFQANGKPQPQPFRMHSTYAGSSGYLSVHIRHDGRRDKIRVHLLVTRAFLGPAPIGQECRHKNGNRLDPRLSNLEYGTRQENMRDAIKHGTFGRLKKNRRLEAQRGADGRFKAGPAVQVPR